MPTASEPTPDRNHEVDMAKTWQQVGDNIRGFVKLPDGWDSHGGKAPPPDVIKKAIRWATTFEALGFPVAWVTLCSNGQINFEWDRDGHTVSVDTDSDTDDRFAAFYAEPVRLTEEQGRTFRKLLGGP